MCQRTGWCLYRQRVSAYLSNSYSKIQASRFDPRMIDQMKVDTGSNVVPLSTIAQVAAKTQISFVVTPFDPSVGKSTVGSV